MTTISWCRNPDGTPGMTWNPIRARNIATGKRGWHCEPVHEGCAHCYAGGQNARLGDSGGTGLPYKPGHRNDVEIYLDEKTLLAPLSWRKPRTIFVCSMTDLYGPWVPDAWIDRIKAVQALTPQHVYVELTKRPGRMRDHTTDIGGGNSVRPSTWGRVVLEAGVICRRLSLDNPSVLKWPLPNVWAGPSCSTQNHANEFIPIVLETPLAHRIVSLEPLLDGIDLSNIEIPLVSFLFDALAGCGRTHLGDAYKTYLDGRRLDLVIMGGESGPASRVTRTSDIRSVVRQCRKAGTPVFVKQLGSNVQDWNDVGFDGCPPSEWPDSTADKIEHNPNGFLQEYQGAPVRIRLKNRKGEDPTEWPEDLRVRQLPWVTTGAAGAAAEVERPHAMPGNA